MLIVLIYIIIGLFAGMIGGLLGIGGGVITVPSFVALFLWMGYPPNDLMPLAVGTSLAVMIFNSFSARRAHYRRGAVNWTVFKTMALGLFLGSFFGAFLTTYLPEKMVEICFGLFLCFLSMTFFFDKLPLFPSSAHLDTRVLKIASGIIGALSSILGIGGGLLTVPLLLSMKMHHKDAIGTSSAITLLVSTMGTLFYILFGWHTQPGIENLGYVNLPAFFIVGITTFFAAPLGVKLAHQLPLKTIRKIFAIVLIVTGLTFIMLNLYF
jgi:uncharacterized membrane protein YfcA